MKLLLQEYRRRTVVPFSAVALAVYYLLVYVPLGKRGKDLDAPLNRSWQQLAASLGRSNAVSIDFLHITNQLNETRQALAILETSKRRAADRVELGPQVKARMTGLFQLVDYENERSKKLEALTTLAKQQQVKIDSPVYSGFPEHTADIRQPELLWAALSMVDSLLTSAVKSKVSALHLLQVPVAFTNSPSNMPLALDEIPILLEVTGPAASVMNLVRSLPLRASELSAAGLPPSTPDKPPLFVDRFIVKKQDPEKPDEVRAWLRVVGFVLRQ